MAGLFKFEDGSLHPGDNFRQEFTKREVRAGNDVIGMAGFGAHVAGAVAIAGALTAQGAYTEQRLLEDLTSFASKVREMQEMQPPVTEDSAHLTAFLMGLGSGRSIMNEALFAITQGGNA